jgi:dihydroxyacetone kinase-like predicted kinase
MDRGGMVAGGVGLGGADRGGAGLGGTVPGGADRGGMDRGGMVAGGVDLGGADRGVAGPGGHEHGGHERDAAFEPAAIMPGPDPEPVEARGKHKRATIVVATGDGLATLFEAEGAAVVAGPNPSTAELLDAIRATGATRVVVLPNASATRGTAAAAGAEARKDGVRVSVVPTRSPVQVLAALAVRDGGRRFEDDVIAMAEAAGACRWAEVTYASKEALTVAGRCEAGDVLALVEGEVNLIGKDLGETCRALLDRLLGGGGELVTMLVGADAPPGFADALHAHVAQRWPFVEAQIYDGGQPHHPLLVGVE